MMLSEDASLLFEYMKEVIIQMEQINAHLAKLTEKFFTAGEKGPAMKVSTWMPTDTAKSSEYGQVVFEPERESTKKEIEHQTTAVLKGIKIVHETEKAIIVEREDGNSAVVAKSHLAKEYSKSDVRTELEFKPERAWALEKLEWKVYDPK